MHRGKFSVLVRYGLIVALGKLIILKPRGNYHLIGSSTEILLFRSANHNAVFALVSAYISFHKSYKHISQNGGSTLISLSDDMSITDKKN